MPKVTSHTPGAPSWADLSTTDDGAALQFYGALFGWTNDPQEMGPDSFYHMQMLNDESVVGICQQGEEENAQNVPPHWNTYFTVVSADETVQKAKDAGGTVLMEAFDVFDAGRMAVIQDPQGAVFMVWQPRGHAGAGVMWEPGSIIWAELTTRDTGEASGFYERVLGVETGPADGPMPYTIMKVGGAEVAGMLNIADLRPDAAGTPPHWSVYFGVADADATVEKAGSLGAAVMVPPMAIPNVGRFSILQDPQGAVFRIFEPA